MTVPPGVPSLAPLVIRRLLSVVTLAVEEPLRRAVSGDANRYPAQVVRIPNHSVRSDLV